MTTTCARADGLPASRDRRRGSCSSSHAPAMRQCEPVSLGKRVWARAMRPWRSLPAICSKLRNGKWAMYKPAERAPPMFTSRLPSESLKTRCGRIATFCTPAGVESNLVSRRNGSRSDSSSSTDGKTLWMLAETTSADVVRRKSPTLHPSANQSSSASNGTTQSAPQLRASAATNVIFVPWACADHVSRTTWTGSRAARPARMAGVRSSDMLSATTTTSTPCPSMCRTTCSATSSSLCIIVMAHTDPGTLDAGRIEGGTTR